MLPGTKTGTLVIRKGAARSGDVGRGCCCCCWGGEEMLLRKMDASFFQVEGCDSFFGTNIAIIRLEEAAEEESETEEEEHRVTEGLREGVADPVPTLRGCAASSDRLPGDGEGEGLLEMEGDLAPLELSRGDQLLIPPHRRHRLLATDPDPGTVWLALFWQGPLPR